VSVAFRRESDDEHKEPRFELPIPPGPNLVTQTGFGLIEARVAELEATLTGDLSEEERQETQRDLRYWNTRHATAEVQSAPSDDEVAFGSHVRFRLNGQERAIDIVGGDEADPAAGRLAFSAPLARAMIGAAPGEKVDFAGKTEAIEIIDTRSI
jgi:transcription elongation GreA/GreB family factor